VQWTSIELKEDDMNTSDPATIHAMVQREYGKIAADPASEKESGCCTTTCCGASTQSAREHAERIGYDAADLDGAPAESNLGLGCGNPTALAALQPGEVVLDLGAGAGFDALIAAKRVGPKGRVIGVDMTPEMLERARRAAVETGYAATVEFREGVIEALPVVSGSVDAVISNCVINLSPDKPQAFREAFRVLRSGGRLAVSDIILSQPLPPGLGELAAAYVACLAGAATEQVYLGAIRDAGFASVKITQRVPAAGLLDPSDPLIKAAIEAVGEGQVKAIADTVFSYAIEARKP
jgi:SAM-dependent methyltransferase